MMGRWRRNLTGKHPIKRLLIAKGRTVPNPCAGVCALIVLLYLPTRDIQLTATFEWHIILKQLVPKHLAQAHPSQSKPPAPKRSEAKLTIVYVVMTKHVDQPKFWVRIVSIG